MDVASIAKRILPDSAVSRIRTYRKSRQEQSGEKPSEWYDKAFEESDTYDKHYTESRHYAIWTVLIDRIRKHSPADILEIACGTGQLASALRDYGLISSYCGLDFSEKRIEFAREKSPDLRFEIADVFKTDLFTEIPYNVVISTEFLEHIEKDLAVIDKIRAGTLFLGTVPNYPWTSHVRHFENTEQVLDRYSSYFVSLEVFPILRHKNDKIIYVMEGQKL